MAIENYDDVIKRTNELIDDILAAFNADDWRAGHAKMDEIGKLIGNLHFRDDSNLASRIAYLISSVASKMYFGGMQRQLNEHARREISRHENTFTPPF